LRRTASEARGTFSPSSSTFGESRGTFSESRRILGEANWAFSEASTAFKEAFQTQSNEAEACSAPIRHPPSAIRNPQLEGTILTGEMFAPILSAQIETYNRLTGAKLHVLAVPNTYFGGDVAVAGLLTGQDYLKIVDRIKGDFVIIPKHTIKSDEPILLDGMTLEELCSKFPVPVLDLDTAGLVKFLAENRSPDEN
jgi:NifB/MoaA-like Fe-S oxidoreductase